MTMSFAESEMNGWRAIIHTPSDGGMLAAGHALPVLYWHSFARSRRELVEQNVDRRFLRLAIC